jgi:uncharacterized protein YqgV (UPF0045/DUF77 family)
MAISDAMRYRMNTGGSAEDLYATIRDFLASSPDANATQAAMRQYGISGEDVSNATGGASGGLLSGNILSGASWNSLNPTLAAELTEATGQATSNYAVGGATTSDTLTQLNTYLAGGGQFDPNATVFLQTGGVDFLQGVDKGTIKDNINQIVKTLADQGVNVVLTGSPYATSINDVVTNNFDPKVDPLFNEIAKENKNVALVGTQGEILQNKKLLVDALHTNAEGTAIYNQSVIDSLSQFKNDVPSSTPDAIAQVQTSNVVATTPAQITQIAQTGQSMATKPRNTVIEGDNIDEQIAALPELMYQTRTNPNNPAIWETYNPKTGEIVDTGVFAGGGDQGLLAASRPVLALAASVLGAPYLSNLIAGSTGLTGSALAGATGATIAGGSTALTGGSAEETLKAALLGGGGAYAGSALKDYIASMDVPVDFSNMTPEQIADATETNFINDLKRAGLSNAQIDDFITNAGGTAVTTPVAVSTPVTDAGAVNVTAPSSLNNVINTIASTVPALTVTGDRQVDQKTLDAVASQLVGNLTSAPTVNITGNKNLTADQVVNMLATTPLTTSGVPTVNVTGTNANLPITIPSVAGALSTINTPTNTATVPTVQVSATKSTNVGDTLATIPSTLVSTPASTTTADKTKETDPLRVAQLALAAAGLLGAGSALSNTGTGTQFPIVPIPEGWRTPPPTGVAPFTPLPPINFGDRNLLIGTQWEKFLDPNYGKVPAPVQYSQPSNLSYNDLMGILGSRQGMPPASSLSINDIISGIQNQYGQAPVSTMG